MRDHELLERPALEPIHLEVKGLFERRRVVVERDKDKASPLSDLDLIEGVVGLGEARRDAPRGGAQKVSFETVSPGVIRTHDARGPHHAATLGAELRAPVPARVVKSTERSFIVTYQEDLLTGQ